MHDGRANASVSAAGTLAGLTFALRNTLLTAMVLIFAFTYYVSVAKEAPLRSHSLEMAGISVGAAALTFVIGYLVRVSLDVGV